jgi:hypothetical protein
MRLHWQEVPLLAFTAQFFNDESPQEYASLFDVINVVTPFPATILVTIPVSCFDRSAQHFANCRGTSSMFAGCSWQPNAPPAVDPKT